jgi:hypothetical protein
VTESEWLTCDNDYLMFQFIRRKADRRKLRLFACACCRRTWDLLPDERSRAAVEVSEGYADGRATKEELSAAQAAAARALDDAEEAFRPLDALMRSGFRGLEGADRARADAAWIAAGRRRYAARAAKAAARPTDRTTTMAEAMGLAAGWIWCVRAIGQSWPVIHSYGLERSDLARCVFGNPFRTQEIAAACLTSDLVGLARSIYEERAFDRLPVLADALEQAGCSNSDALTHCLRAGPHERGCWVLDAILASG